MSARSLDVVEASVLFSGLRALDGVSLSVGAGEIVGLIGPNGSGKTTLVNAITGQVPLAGGRVLLDGDAISGLPPRVVALKGITRSFQIVRLFNNMTVRENVEAASLARGDSSRTARSKADALLNEFGLAGRADDLGAALSYGDKRRVEIARGARRRSGVPVARRGRRPGMNEAESGVLLQILRDLPRARGSGLVIIDHDMGLIMRSATGCMCWRPAAPSRKATRRRCGGTRP
jgi:branched-chain amino acid transport system ATP-binding protein